jgi:AAA15 family ATPase/GTPase
MLIRFTVSNFCSFKDEAELSMLPSRERSHKNQVYKAENSKTTNLLRGAVIYGSNASGKSNLVKAIAYAKNLIIRGKPANKKLDLPYFKLDKNSSNIPSRFEFEIQINKTMYAYGFELFNTHIHEEWLYKIKAQTEELIFERKNIEDKPFQFGSDINKLAKEDLQVLEFVAKGTRPNQLFLTESIDRNLNYFMDVHNWFADTLKIISPISKVNGIEFTISEDSTFKDYLTKVLELADTGIKEIKTEEFSLNELGSAFHGLIDKLQEDLDDDEAAFIADYDSGKRIVIRKKQGELKAYKLSTIHSSEETGMDISFDLEEESDGTRRLIELTPALYEMAFSNKGSVYIIDEIDRSLHPHLSSLLVHQHLESDNNAKSQLIVTTHETSLLDVSLIRRDEIWFIEKNNKGQSKLYSLNNFQPRYDKDIRKDYLLGRYGAIPFVGDFKRLKR